MNYSLKLKDPRWQKKRLEILQRDEFECTYCGDKESEIHVHHSYYEFGKEIWEYESDTLYTLCSECHYKHSLCQRSIKEHIRKLHYDSLYEFNDIAEFCSMMNPYELSQVKKFCDKILNK